MARRRGAEQWAEHRRQREEAELQSRVMVITEFDAGDPEATMHALADEILKYRRAVKLLAKAIGWADAGSPFALISPGPHWRPRRTTIDGDVAPLERVRRQSPARQSHTGRFRAPGARVNVKREAKTQYYYRHQRGQF